MVEGEARAYSGGGRAPASVVDGDGASVVGELGELVGRMQQTKAITVVASVELGDVGGGRRRARGGSDVRVVGGGGVPRAHELGRVLGKVRWTGSRRLVEVVGLGDDGGSG